MIREILLATVLLLNYGYIEQIVSISSSSAYFIQKPAEEDAKMVASTLIVNGSELESSRYTTINLEQRYAMVPLVSILEELGYKIIWNAEHIATVEVYGKKYVLNTKESSLTIASGGFNFLCVAPGSKHGSVTSFNDGVFIIDSDSILFFLNRIIGAKLNIDYDNAVVYVQLNSQNK